MKTATCVVALALAGAGCAAGALTYNMRSTTDEFTGNGYDLMNDNVLSGGATLGFTRLALDFQRFRPRSGPISYQVFAVYNGSDWIFIEEGESLLLLIDGSTTMLSSRRGSLGSRDVVSGGRVWEMATYQIEPELIKRLASASDVRVRVQGSDGRVERHFGPENFKRLREFVSAYVN